MESFPTFSSNNKVLISGYIKKESKKKKQSSKYEAKETRVIQNEKSFFKTEKKTKHGKIT